MKALRKVLYFSEGYSPHDFRFLSSLAGTAMQVYWLQLNNKLDLENRPVPDRIKKLSWPRTIPELNWRHYWWLKSQFNDQIKKIQPDLVHAGPIQKVSFLPAIINFHPLVSMSWGTDMVQDADHDIWWRWVTRFTLRHTDVLVGDCQAVMQKAQNFGFKLEKSVLFPWGIDLEIFKPNPARLTKFKSDSVNDFIILCTRNWEERYGVDLVIRGFARAHSLIPNVRLLLIGSGSREKLLRNLVSEHQLSDRVLFVGQVPYDKLPAYYQSADLYVSASYSDGSSVSMMEALGCGCPVLVSDISSNQEWIIPDKQGWFFRCGDEEDLGNKLIFIYQKRKRLAEYKKAARQLAVERADWNKNFQRLLYAYDLAMTSRK